MKLQEAYLVKIYNNLKDQKEKINKKDYRFFQIDIILELARRSQIFSNECEQCKINKEILEEISQTADEKLKTIKGRTFITKNIDKITKHLRKKHKIYLKGYLVSLWSFIGIIAGILLGLATSYLFKIQATTIILITFTVGLFLGRFVGMAKEKNALKQDKIISPKITSMLEEILIKQQNQNTKK